MIGEKAFVVYAITNNLLGEEESKRSGETSSVDPEENDCSNKSADPVPTNVQTESRTEVANVDVDRPFGASQVDTSVALSARTLDDLFGLESDDESQTNVGERHVLGAFQLLLSGAESNVESDNGEAASPASGVASDIESADNDVTTVLDADDVNVLVSGEISDDYDAIESSGSEDSDEEADESVSRREYPQVELLDDDEVAHMDEAFIQSLGGNLTLEAMDKTTLRQFEWGPVSSEFETNVDEYPGMCQDVAAPLSHLQDIADSPLLLLFYFMPRSL